MAVMRISPIPDMAGSHITGGSLYICLYLCRFFKSSISEWSFSDLHRRMRFYALQGGTFASSKDLSIAGRGFKSSLYKISSSYIIGC